MSGFVKKCSEICGGWGLYHNLLTLKLLRKTFLFTPGGSDLCKFSVNFQLFVLTLS